MRSYATLSPMFWTRGSGKRLRGQKEAQLVALYLMSSPGTNMVGIFHLALPTLCHETGLSLQEASMGLARCSEEGLVFWDEDEELVFVPALAKHQIGEKLDPKDHKVKGVVRELAPYKGHRFFGMFMDRYADLYSLPTELDEGASESPGRDDVPVPVPVLSGLDPDSGSDAREPASGVVAAAAPIKRARAKRSAAPETPIPDPFVPTESHRKFCAEHSLDLALEAQGLVAWAEGKTAASWNGTFTTRLINSVKWSRERGRNGNSNGRRIAAPRQPDSGYSPSAHAKEIT